MPLSNRDLAELLAVAAGDQEPASQRQRALLRASRAALGWEIEVAALRNEGRDLTDLPRVGPWIARLVDDWLTSDLAPPPPPPERAGFLSRAEALATIAGEPRWANAVRADLQMHTTRSDGHADLLAMTRRCVELGYTHLAVTDHSHGLPIAHGMSDATREEQALEVAALNRSLASEGIDMVVLHGLEMNLTPDGAGDTDPAALARLDLVLGAFHSKLRLEEDQTQRYLRALANPTIDVLAHPRGRMYNRRRGLRARWEDVFEAAAERGVALEVDAYPDRQDLDVDLLRLAARYDVWIAVDTDAHHPIDLDAMPFGVAALAQAGVRRDRVLNTLSRDELRAWLEERRRRRG